MRDRTSPAARVARVLVLVCGAICLSTDIFCDNCDTSLETCLSQRSDLEKMTPSILSDSTEVILPDGVTKVVVGIGPAGRVGVNVNIAVLDRFSLSLFAAM